MNVKQFFLNAINSWVTSLTGIVLGVPEIWEGLKPLLDDDPATGVVWGTLMTGVGILVVGLFTRDWTKGLIKSERNPNIK